MNTFKHIRVSILAALMLAGGLVGGAVASAQNDTDEGASLGAPTEKREERGGPVGVTFPIAELGGCTDKASCKAYCDDAAHVDACVAFASAHGLMNKDEAARAKRFGAAVIAGSGPGGCTSPKECKSYCEDMTHLDECVQFAEKQGMQGKEFEQGKKISAFLKKGGKTPGGCTSKSSCEAYCGDFTHAEECATFAQGAGIMQEGGRGTEMKRGPGAPGEDDDEDMPTPEQFKKLSALAKSGETPGGCKNKDACMAYCKEESHFDECATFGEKVGFMKKEDADRMRAFREKGGPGGCKSPEACHAYCNDDAHREECFKFAQENGLISEKELAQMKEGMVRMREGLDNAPPEVKACLTSALGEDTISALESGKLAPSAALGEKMRTCFEKFGAHHDPREAFKEAPPQVLSCLKEKLGDQFTAIESGKMEPTPEMADAFRVCFQQMQMMGQGGEDHQGGMPDPERMRGFIKNAPPEVSACLKEKLAEKFEKFQSGEVEFTPEIGETMRACFEQFRPAMGGEGRGPMMGQGEGEDMQKGAPMIQRGTPMGTPGEWTNRMPPAVATCLKEKLGEEGFAKLNSSAPSAEIKEVLHACYEAAMGAPQQGGTLPQGGNFNHDASGAPIEGSQMMPPPGANTMLSRLPEAAQSCLKAKLGEEGFAKLGTSQPTPEIAQVISGCLAQLQQFPQSGSGGAMTGMPPPTGTMMPPSEGMLPPPPDSGTMPPPPSDAQMMTQPLPPPPETTAPQSRRSIPELLIGAVAASFEKVIHLIW